MITDDAVRAVLGALLDVRPQVRAAERRPHIELLARAMVDRARTPKQREWAIEDLTGRGRFPGLPAEVRAELLGKLRAALEGRAA